MSEPLIVQHRTLSVNEHGVTRTFFYNAKVKHWDVIVVGGGIIGISLSIELRRQGAEVLVLERGEPGREASYAAGGMLVDCAFETPPALRDLATASASMYPEFVRQLQLDSGLNVDLRDHGTIFFPSENSSEDAESNFEVLSAEEVPALEPFLAKTRRAALLLRERSVDPRGLMAAAIAAAKRLGVDISSGEEVTAVEVANDRVCGVETKKTKYPAAKVVNCAGAWSGQIEPYAPPTRPVKGQMLCLLSPSRELLKHVIRAPEAYLIPRSDGRILVGATLEEAGFDKRTDVEAIQRLRRAAITLVPELKNAKILGDWAGLRPATPDKLPILGAFETEGYYVATGHYRDGILLAPVTARVMGQLMSGIVPDHNLQLFSPARFSITANKL